MHSFLHPVVPAEQHAHKGGDEDAEAAAQDISVLVVNAGDITGEASDTSYKLGKAGFATKTLPASTPANAAQTLDTVVYYDPSQANGERAAEELAPLFGSHTSVAPMTTAIASLAHEAGDPLTVVAIGTSYSGKLKLPHTAKPPTPHPRRTRRCRTACR